MIFYIINTQRPGKSKYFLKKTSLTNQYNNNIKSLHGVPMRCSHLPYCATRHVKRLRVFVQTFSGVKLKNIISTSGRGKRDCSDLVVEVVVVL